MRKINALSDRFLSRFLKETTAAADECETVTQKRIYTCPNGKDFIQYRKCTVCRLGGTHCGAWSTIYCF